MRRVMLLVMGVVASAVLSSCALQAVTGVTSDGATLSASWDTGDDARPVWFEYGHYKIGQDTGEGATRTASQTVRAHSDLGEVHVTLDGLAPARGYFYRACSLGDHGEDICLPWDGFDTPPTIAGLCEDLPWYFDCEPAYAAKVKPTSATLVGRGFSTDAAVRTWFEYAPGQWDVDSDVFSRTPEQAVAASAPIGYHSADITGLEPASDYQYRVCARATDGRGGCTRLYSFTTPKTYVPLPGGTVRVTGSAKLDYATDNGPTLTGLDFDVSAPAGGGISPTGSVSGVLTDEAGVARPFDGPLTCLAIHGKQAVVRFFSPSVFSNSITTVVLTDNGGNGKDTFVFGSASYVASDCTLGPESGWGYRFTIDGRVTVTAAG